MVDAISQERRARLAAERLLELKQSELYEANRELSRHAKHLSDEISQKREEAVGLLDENSRAKKDLLKATVEADLAQKRLWESMQGIPDGMALFDADDTLIAANPAYLDVFDGLEAVRPGISYAELVRLAVEEGVIDTHDLSREAFIAEALERWRNPQSDPVVLRLWSDHYIKMLDQRGASGDTVSLGINITSTVQNERKLKTARANAEAASRAKSTFLANMSHEIRTPMNGIVGMADLLLETSISDDQRLYAETIRNSGDALLALINGVLDYSKLEASKLQVFESLFDLEQCIQQVSLLLQPAATQKNVEIEIDYDIFLPTKYYGDLGRIRQVLTNLVGNAVKFTQEGRVSVRVVGFNREDSDEFKVHITVDDTGIGIAAADLKDIFAEFHQAQNALSRDFEGTGLGLSIAQGLVELMGGELWVESVEGQGSCFGFNLPLRAAQMDEPQTWPLAAAIIDTSTTLADQFAKQLTGFGVEASVRSDDAALDDIDVLFFSADHPRAAELEARAMGLSPAPKTIAISSGAMGAGGPAKLESTSLFRPFLRADLVAVLSSISPIDRRNHDTTNCMRILAADDNKTNRLVMEKMLSGLEVELMLVSGGQAAIDACAGDMPDLIFMDISMPGMDGKEASQHIRALECGQNVPIIAVTAHATDTERDAILAAGIDHFLTKPLRKKDLMDVVAKYDPNNGDTLSQIG